MKYEFRGDEPMVVLDTLKDWRFEKNVRCLPSTRAFAEGFMVFCIASDNRLAWNSVLRWSTLAHARRIQYWDVSNFLFDFSFSFA